MIQMLSMMTIDPESTDNEMENYKYANTICEILTHDGNVFSNLIATNRKYLLILWSFLDESCRNEISVESEQQQQQSDDKSADTNIENLTMVNETQSIETNEDENENQDHKTEKEIVDETETNIIENNMVEENDKELESKEKEDEKQKPSKQTKPVDGRSLNPLLASFFTKVFSYMFMHDMELVLEFLLTRNPPNDLVTVILKHIQASAIMDFIYKTWKYVNVDQIGQQQDENKVSIEATTTMMMTNTDTSDNDQQQQQQQQESLINLKYNNVSLSLTLPFIYVIYPFVFFQTNSY